jgi:hypothetical protein
MGSSVGYAWAVPQPAQTEVLPMCLTNSDGRLVSVCSASFHRQGQCQPGPSWLKDVKIFGESEQRRRWPNEAGDQR